MANGRINFGKQSGGVLGLLFPDGATNTEVMLPESGTLATTASATESAQGLIELATTAETQDGTDDTRAITPLKLKNSVLGLGQTWQDVTASRIPGTTYTNSTGKAILLSIYSESTAIASVIQIEIDTVIRLVQGSSSPSVTRGVSIIVPSGSTYKISLLNGTIMKWSELR